MTVRRPLSRCCALFTGLAVVLLLLPGHGADAATNDIAVPPHFTGVDGLVYDSAPLVVAGLDGDLYAGWELDYACALGGRHLNKSISQIAKFAAMLERSGRKVVYTVAPGKTWGLSQHLDPVNLPQGVCDSIGVEQQNEVLDRKRTDYLPLRPALASEKLPVYWKTDPHWNTVGAATFAKSVAGALDPKLGHAQRYTYSTETRLGLLTAEQGGDTPEVGPRAVPAGGVKTRTARGTPDWSGYPSVTFDHSWVSGPRGKTWPGRTLLLGDSFMWYALESLQPVFRQGRFIWLGKVPVDSLLRAIRRADTVVLESYAVFGSPLSAPAFRKAVAQALAKK